MSIFSNGTTSDPAWAPDLGIFNVSLNIDDTIVTNDTRLWSPSTLNSSEGTLSFCVRVDIFNTTTGFDSINFVTTYPFVTVTFNNETSKLEAIDNVVVVDDFVNTVATVDYTVLCCQCDENNLCYEPALPVEAGSDLRLCIQALSGDVMVEGIVYLRLDQNQNPSPDVQDFATITTPISSGIPSVTTAMNLITNSSGDRVAVVVTRMISAFFESPDPGVVRVIGQVNLMFSSSMSARMLQLSPGGAEFLAQITLLPSTPGAANVHNRSHVSLTWGSLALIVVVCFFHIVFKNFYEPRKQRLNKAKSLA